MIVKSSVPRHVQTDLGKEFYNTTVQDLFHKLTRYIRYSKRLWLRDLTELFVKDLTGISPVKEIKSGQLYFRKSLMPTITPHIAVFKVNVQLMCTLTVIWMTGQHSSLLKQKCRKGYCKSARWFVFHESPHHLLLEKILIRIGVRKYSALLRQRHLTNR